MGVTERKEREKKMRRDQIQMAAKQVFLDRGFHAATMEEIAEAAEFSVGSLYQYFVSKDELYASLNILSLQFLDKEITKIKNRKNSNGQQKLRALHKALLKTYEYDPLILRNILHIQLDGNLGLLSEELLSQIQELTQKCVRGIASLFEEGIRKKEFRNHHSMALTDIAWGMFTGIVVYETSKTQLNPRKDYLKSTLRKAFEIFHKGISKEN
jgi:AcrR family transcriptional regulator